MQSSDLRMFVEICWSKLRLVTEDRRSIYGALDRVTTQMLDGWELGLRLKSGLAIRDAVS